VDAANAALHDNPDDPEALAIKGLLLRLQAAGAPDDDTRGRLLRDADDMRARALAAQKKRRAGL
jgi:hypothetical protein